MYLRWMLAQSISFRFPFSCQFRSSLSIRSIIMQGLIQKIAGKKSLNYHCYILASNMWRLTSIIWNNTITLLREYGIQRLHYPLIQEYSKNHTRDPTIIWNIFRNYGILESWELPSDHSNPSMPELWTLEVLSLTQPIKARKSHIYIYV